MAFYVQIVNGKATRAASSDELKAEGIDHAAREAQGWQTSWDWSDFLTVELIANELSAATGRDFLPCDRGDHVSPRYDVIEAPKLGDDVSRGFNGDYYPVGKVTRITGAGRRIIETKDERGTVRKFYRVKLSAAWREGKGSPFCLVPGVRSEWNREF